MEGKGGQGTEPPTKRSLAADREVARRPEMQRAAQLGTGAAVHCFRVSSDARVRACV